MNWSCEQNVRFFYIYCMFRSKFCASFPVLRKVVWQIVEPETLLHFEKVRLLPILKPFQFTYVTMAPPWGTTSAVLDYEPKPPSVIIRVETIYISINVFFYFKKILWFLDENRRLDLFKNCLKSKVHIV